MNRTPLKLRAAFALCALVTVAFAQADEASPAPSHGFQVVYQFNSNDDGRDGVHPQGGVLTLPDGSLIGTTNLSGAHKKGVIYRIALPDGAETVVHDFKSSEGEGQYQPLVLASDGHVYGVSMFGGPSYAGTVWRIDPDGSHFTVVHAFAYSDVAYSPSSPLVEGSDGNLYGATAGSETHGAIYRMTPAGDVTVVHAFAVDGSEGYTPGALLLTADGDLYGTARSGGTLGGGTFYRLKQDGSFQVLHNFDATAEGALPFGRFVQAPDGSFYGVARHDGPRGWGTAWHLAPDGALTVLHAFGNDPGEGSSPVGLTRLADGTFYGTTDAGGADAGDGFGFGTVYKMNARGKVTVLHRFRNRYGGHHPSDQALALGTDGRLYGTCWQGGRHLTWHLEGGMGTVYRFTP